MTKQLFYLFTGLSFLLIMSCKTPTGNNSSTHKDSYTNHLIHEKSPYLLQHAHNPVNWYPWGEEALEKAKKENKMLIISVGYAACHWCHVMEHESFEDTAVAQLMNDHFVAIKVDREERPDIDDVYMSACQLVSKRGCGWPLNAFALPDGRPVWAGTYFPKDNWIDVLNHFIQLQKDDPDKMQRSAQQIVQGIQQMDAQHFTNIPTSINEETLQEVTRKLLSTRDLKLGGRRGQPKFPLPVNYEFLLNQYHNQNDQSSLDATITTLDHMANGGIYDQIAGGFSRYSTDNKWLVPHFEKMLYDNAQLISLYAHAYTITHSPLYRKVIQNTIAFAERELRSQEGGFFASLDADSEGEEGKFYIWTQEEFNNTLGDDQMIFVATEYYHIIKNGNWEDGKNILHVVKSVAELAKKYNKRPEEITSIIEACDQLLMAERSNRIRPGLDDKILTSWNSLMISAYADAYRALGDESYRLNALKTLEFIQNKMLQSDGRLNRNYKDGLAGINAFAEDYALLIKALTDIYEITFDEKHLELAQKLTEYMLEHFFDEGDRMFYFTSDIDPALIHRNRVITDNVIPGSNSVMANNLHRLGILLDNNKYMQLSIDMLQKIAPQIESINQPDYYANWCILYAKMLQRPYEVAIVGPNYEAKRKEFQQHFTPNAVFLGGANEGKLALLENKLIDNETYIYVCLNKVCKLPVKEVSHALELMD